MRSIKTITVIGCHAEGEVGRVITGGVLAPPGNTLFDKKRYLESAADDLRKFLLYEPRGGAFVHANLIVPATRDDTAAGFIIMEPTDYPPMSGSNSMLTVVTLARGPASRTDGSRISPMPADVPTILATSGGLVPGRRHHWSVGPLTELAVDLAGVEGRAPRVCFVGTAGGDNPEFTRAFYDLCQQSGFHGNHLQLFLMPNVDDITALLLEQDVVWVFGGSVAGLLAMWELHGVGDAMRTAWQAGVVLTGVSAGSICWHVGGTTDSFGPELRPVTNGLGFVPFSNGVHYDSEEERRPLYHRLIADGTLPAGYATDDGAGVLYRGTEFAGAYAEHGGAGAYFVEPGPDGTAVETAVDVTLLR